MLRNLIFPIARTKFQVINIRNKQKKVPKIDKKLQAATESLAARGFLRPNKPWDPPANIDEMILKICSENGLNSKSEFNSLEVKFVVLKSCYEETGHSVPNSL
ncbi:unnamed protein product [Leptidea sinapis]|uniref:39S ribosomal protein L50, mitochondrial n=2 Tax=Leptidea sinapis TaxID=189913 RepID=A0A5E4PUB0_9NEOP|nr:unnamed protein product [Leptidea sinapis]